MTDQTQRTDMYSMWREWSLANQDVWGQMMTSWVRSDAFATALGKTLESYLTTQNVFARAMQQYLEQALRGLNIISAADAEKLSQQVVDLESKVDAVSRQVKAIDVRGQVHPILERLDSLDDIPSSVRAEIQPLRDRVDAIDVSAEVRKQLRPLVERVNAIDVGAEVRTEVQPLADRVNSIDVRGDLQPVLDRLNSIDVEGQIRPLEARLDALARQLDALTQRVETVTRQSQPTGGAAGSETAGEETPPPAPKPTARTRRTKGSDEA